MTALEITLDRPELALEPLARDGYAVVRDVLSPAEVERARAVCDRYVLADDRAENEIEATDLLRTPELNFVFNERILSALTRWLGGSLVYYPNYIARINRRTGWHVDNGFHPDFLAAAEHLYDPEFRHLQCVVYLQDNRPGAGGGLDVRPGSHRWAAQGRRPDDNEIARRYPASVTLDSRAGDLVVFDGRLSHRGTPADGTHEHRKYGVFWSASRADAVQIDRYLDYFSRRVTYLRTRALPAEEMARDERRHRLMRAVRFPASYLPAAVDSLRACGVALAEMPGDGTS